jgi:hypothetical protein
VWFQYLPDRKGWHPQRHLKDFHGILQADAYGGWAKLYEGEKIVEAACWVHARRPWWDLYLSLGRAPGTVAEQALKRIANRPIVSASIGTSTLQATSAFSTPSCQRRARVGSEQPEACGKLGRTARRGR